MGWTSFQSFPPLLSFISVSETDKQSCSCRLSCSLAPTFNDTDMYTLVCAFIFQSIMTHLEWTF